MGALRFEEALLTQVADRLDLREPNRDAIDTVIKRTSAHYDIDESTEPYECVVDSATGVGKTYVMAGLVEYFALRQDPARNYLVLAPGRTIRDKTVHNFTPGHRKSLTGSMISRPYLVTADNFATASTRAAMADPNRTKVYVFTVQALTSATGEGRATHDFREELGTSFYSWLAELDDLVIIADEHHCYRGKAFSKTIRDLDPELVVGLTATPDPADEGLVVYRYPLAAAIADRYVKAPVLVGRRDDRSDPKTKLLDGVNLLSAKESALRSYALDEGLRMVNPVMLVVAGSIAEAEALRDILDSAEFDGGRWVNTTLLVHSGLTGEEKERALADLEAVESPDSPIRVILNVGMLKEGWDVKNIYVIASFRPSVSDVLTEQTLGRGLRLPFGEYTDVEFLDTVEVVAHERYESLLKKRQALNESFIDYRTYAATRKLDNGDVVVVTKYDDVEFEVLPGDPESGDAPPQGDTSDAAGGEPAADESGDGDRGAGRIVDIETRRKQAPDTELATETVCAPLTDREPIIVPKVTQTPIQAEVSLGELIDMAPFTALGVALSNGTEADLIRTKITAKRTGDGVAVGTEEAEDAIEAAALDTPIDVSRGLLIERVLSVKGVQRRTSEVRFAQQIVDTMIDAMGDHGAAVLSAFEGRAGQRLANTVTNALSDQVGSRQVKFAEEVTFEPLTAVRTTYKPLVESHPTGAFERTKAYDGWKKHLYAYTWFDTKPEYEAAIAIDDAKTVVVWARLGLGDIPITWNADGRKYNPDFVVIEEVDGDRFGWLVETKANKDMTATEVVQKRRGARRWANQVNLDSTDMEWGYLLLSEDDVYHARGSWLQMKAFAS